MSDHVSTSSTNWGRDKAGPRTVAVILGWQRRMQMIDGRETTSPSSHWFHPANPRRFVDEPTVTVDDMLAWLNARDCEVVWAAGSVRVRGSDVRRDFDAPTMFAALEAAVLAVDEAQR